MADAAVPGMRRESYELLGHFLPRQLAERLHLRRAYNAALGHDGGYVCRRRHVEGRVFDLHAIGRHLLAGDMRDLARAALFDGNLAAVRGIEINGRKRGGYVEGNPMGLGQDRKGEVPILLATSP